MGQRLIQEETLDNGVTLRLYDRSRRLAADRWLVSLEARAVVTVTEDLRSKAAETPEDLSEIKQALNDEVVFEQKRERYFIDENDKNNVFEELVRNWQSGSKAYLAHPEFPLRFVKKTLKEHLAKKQRQTLMSSRD